MSRQHKQKTANCLQACSLSRLPGGQHEWFAGAGAAVVVVAAAVVVVAAAVVVVAAAVVVVAAAVVVVAAAVVVVA